MSGEAAPRREVQLDHGTVRYRDEGQGQVLVFVHGLFVNADLWDAVIPRLSGQYRCIAPDLPLGAHHVAARKDADLTFPGVARLVADLMAALELDDVTLVGNDTGGAICQIVVARHPERLGGLVLTTCDALENFLPPVFRPLQYAARLPGFVWTLAQPFRLQVARRAFLATVAKRRTRPEVLTSFSTPLVRDPAVRHDTAKVLRGISNKHTLDAALSFPSFRKPVAIAWTEKDPFFPLSYGERLQRSFPDATLEAVSDTRTFIPIDRPDAVVNAVASVSERVAA